MTHITGHVARAAPGESIIYFTKTSVTRGGGGGGGGGVGERNPVN